ncbi:MAG: GNAT family N-acetyltransferase [Alphaproteobacteria bacterium]
MWQIRNERAGDAEAVEKVITLGFGAGRFAKTAYRLREGVNPEKELCFVAEDGGKLVGAVRFWPIKVGGQNSLLLGPLAVQPKLRGKGIGIALMQKGIEAARKRGHATILLVGDEPYYGRVGFAKIKPGQVRFPGPVDPDRILGLGLRPGALEKLEGAVARARIDIPVSANAAPLG